jgi:hypothetical protein
MSKKMLFAAAAVLAIMPISVIAEDSSSSLDFLLSEAVPVVQTVKVVKIPIFDRYLLGGVLAVRLADAHTTHHMLVLGNLEAELPAALAGNQAAMYSFSIGMAGLQSYTSY